MKYIIYLFYRYYDKDSTKSIAYESAIMATFLLLFLNFFVLDILFNINLIHSLLMISQGYQSTLLLLDL